MPVFSVTIPTLTGALPLAELPLPPFAAASWDARAQPVATSTNAASPAAPASALTRGAPRRGVHERLSRMPLTSPPRDMRGDSGVSEDCKTGTHQASTDNVDT